MGRRAFLRWLIGALGVLTGSVLWMQLRGRLPGGNLAEPAEDPLPSPAADKASGGKEEPAEQPVTEVLAAFALISDLHVNADVASISEALRRALLDVTSGAYRSQALFLTGDVTDYGRDQDYKQLMSVLKEFKLPPVHANMGNHDYYDIWFNAQGNFDREAMPNGKKDLAARTRFMQAFGYDRIYHDFWIGDCHFILLSMEAYMQEKPEHGEGAWYSDEQMRWLTGKMEEHKEGKPAFVMIHQPLPPVGTPGASHTLIRATEFHAIMKNCPNVFVFCGHRHQDFQNKNPHYRKETPNLHQFHNSSVVRVLKENYQSAGAEKSQGMYVEVYADRVRLRGRDLAGGKWLPEADWTVPLKPGLKKA